MECSQSSSMTLVNPPGSRGDRASVIDQNVDPTEVGGSSDQLDGSCSRREVDGHEDNASAGLKSGKVGARGAGSGNHHGALVDQRPGDRPADSLTCTGDDGDLPTQMQVHTLLLTFSVQSESRC
jgi:hypothetical protein